jgi:hypothetical protein
VSGDSLSFALPFKSASVILPPTKAARSAGEPFSAQPRFVALAPVEKCLHTTLGSSFGMVTMRVPRGRPPWLASKFC